MDENSFDTSYFNLGLDGWPDNLDQNEFYAGLDDVSRPASDAQAPFAATSQISAQIEHAQDIMQQAQGIMDALQVSLSKTQSLVSNGDSPLSPEREGSSSR